MNQIDPVYVLELIDGSKLLKAEQKQIMKDKLSTLSLPQLADLVKALQNEQQILSSYYKNVAHLRKVSAEKKVKAYYDYAEESIEHKEAIEISQIEEELFNI